MQSIRKSSCFLDDIFRDTNIRNDNISDRNDNNDNNNNSDNDDRHNNDNITHNNSKNDNDNETFLNFELWVIAILSDIRKRTFADILARKYGFSSPNLSDSLDNPTSSPFVLKKIGTIAGTGVPIAPLGRAIIQTKLPLGSNVQQAPRQRKLDVIKMKKLKIKKNYKVKNKEFLQNSNNDETENPYGDDFEVKDDDENNDEFEREMECESEKENEREIEIGDDNEREMEKKKENDNGEEKEKDIEREMEMLNEIPGPASSSKWQGYEQEQGQGDISNDNTLEIPFSSSDRLMNINTDEKDNKDKDRKEIESESDNKGRGRRISGERARSGVISSTFDCNNAESKDAWDRIRIKNSKSSDNLDTGSKFPSMLLPPVRAEVLKTKQAKKKSSLKNDFNGFLNRPTPRCLKYENSPNQSSYSTFNVMNSNSRNSNNNSNNNTVGLGLSQILIGGTKAGGGGGSDGVSVTADETAIRDTVDELRKGN